MNDKIWFYFCIVTVLLFVRHEKNCLGRGLYICNVCGEMCGSFERLSLHAETHRKEKKYFQRVNEFKGNVLSSKKYRRVASNSRDWKKKKEIFKVS